MKLLLSLALVSTSLLLSNCTNGHCVFSKKKSASGSCCSTPAAGHGASCCAAPTAAKKTAKH